MTKLPWPLLAAGAAALLIVAVGVVALTATAEGEVFTARAGDDFAVECTSPAGALVALDGSASTPGENDTLSSFVWLENGQTIATGATPSVQLPLGTHEITLSIMNATNDTRTDNVTVIVRDTTAPSLTAAVVGNGTIWPPNHKLRDVEVAVSVSDACTASPTFTLRSAQSDEADDGLGDACAHASSSSAPACGGDGRTTGDLQGADVGTSDTSFTLRAERAGPGDGRTYVLTYEATDASGNKATASATFVVPHDVDES